MLQRAETEIIKMCQSSHFWKEIEAVNAGNRVPSTSSIHKLDPFLDKYGVLQSGWENFKIKFEPWAEASSFGFQISNHIKIDHQVLSHSGRCMIINEIRNAGYWMANCNSPVKSLIADYLQCHLQISKRNNSAENGWFSDRKTFPGATITCCGIGMFGPILVKEGRKEIKRYGCLFTCLSTRAIHIESTS